MKKLFNLVITAILICMLFACKNPANPTAVDLKKQTPNSFKVTIEKGEGVSDDDFSISYKDGDSATAVEKGNSVTITANANDIFVDGTSLEKSKSKDLVVNSNINICIEKGTEVALKFTGIDAVTEKCGSLYFYTVTPETDTYGNISYENETEYISGTKVARNTYIKIKVVVKKTDAITAMGVPNPDKGWINLKPNKTILGRTRVGFIAEKNFNITPDGKKIEGGEGPSGYDKKQWFAFKLDKNINIDITAKEPADKTPPAISTVAESKNIETSEIASLAEPTVTATDGNCNVTRVIETTISGTKTTETNWATTIAKTFTAGDSIEVIFTAEDTSGNKATKVVRYTIVKWVHLTSTGHDMVTDKTGALEFFISKTSSNTLGSLDDNNKVEYEPDTKINAGTYIYIKSFIKKGSEINGEASITLTPETDITAETEEYYMPKTITITSSGFEIKGVSGQYANDITKWLAIKLESDVSLTVTSKEPADTIPPVISSDVESKDVYPTTISNLPEPTATAKDIVDGAVTVTKIIKTTIGTTTTTEPDWATAIEKTFAIGDTIKITFIAKDSNNNEASKEIIYTVADLAKTALNCTNLDTLTPKTGSVNFYITKKIKNEYGMDVYSKDTPYTLGDEVPNGTKIYIEVNVNKTEEFSPTPEHEDEYIGWITLSSAQEIEAETEENWLTKTVTINNDGYKVKGAWGSYGRDKTQWFVITLDKSITLNISSKEPK